MTFFAYNTYHLVRKKHRITKSFPLFVQIGARVIAGALYSVAVIIIQAESSGGDGATVSRGAALNTALSCITRSLVTLLMR